MTDTINKLGTSRYQAFQPWMGVPIQISNTAPKWMPGLDYITAFKPVGIQNIEPEFAFREVYNKRLDGRADEIHAALLALSSKYPNERLVMLCWDDLDDLTAWCHRTVAADWLRAKGLEVLEMPRFKHEVPGYESVNTRNVKPLDVNLPPSLF